MPNVQTLQSGFYGKQYLPTIRLFEVAGAIRSTAHRWRASKAVLTLGRLDDELLQDIGVDRHELSELLRTLPLSAIPGVLQSLRTERSIASIN